MRTAQIFVWSNCAIIEVFNPLSKFFYREKGHLFGVCGLGKSIHFLDKKSMTALPRVSC